MSWNIWVRYTLSGLEIVHTRKVVQKRSCPIIRDGNGAGVDGVADKVAVRCRREETSISTRS